MTEVAVAASAFDAELGKALASLPAYPAVDQHEQVLAHQRMATKIQELCEYYVTKKLPPFAFAPRLLAAGAQLIEKGEYDLAAASCFERLVQLNLPRVSEVSKLDAIGKLAIHVQALYGLHSCQAAKALRRDPHITHITTLQIVLQALAGIKDGCSQAVLQQQLYWLVYNATVLIHKTASVLVTAGHFAEMLPYYVFAAKALESHLSLSSSEFLPWRLQMYSAAAHCYSALHAASTVTDAGQAVQAAATTTPSSKAAAVNRVGSSAAASGDTGKTQDTAAYITLARKFLQDGLSQIQRVQARTTLDPVPPPPAVKTALLAALSQLTALTLLFEMPAAAAGAQPATGGSSDSSTGANSIHAALAELKHDNLKLQVLLRLLLAGAGSSRQPLQQVVLPQHLQPVMDAATELLSAAVAAAEQQVPQWETLTTQLHLSFLCVSYRYSQHELLKKLLAAVKLRLAALESKTRSSSGPSGCTCLAATAAVIDAVQQLQVDAGESSLGQMAACLKQYSAPLGQCLPGLLAAAAIKLHIAASKLLHSCFALEDSQAELTQLVLEGLHEALQQSDCDDGLLRGCIAIRLAVMLQQQQDFESAVDVIQQGLAAINAARVDALWQLHGSTDEHLRWITGSRTQAVDAIAALVSGMSPTEQELASLHADAMLVLQRLQLSLGLRDAAAKAVAKRNQMLASTIKRDKQSAIYGPRTLKEKRLDEEAIEAAGKAPNRNEVCESELLLQCSKNFYQRALLLTQIAAVQTSAETQSALLEEACNLLAAAQAREAELFASQQPPATSSNPNNPHAKLLQPKVLCRTPNSVTVTHHPVNMKGYRQPASFAVYCKLTGAGVALSINKTSMEYPGSGVKVALGSRVTIEGLQGNETYVFALAVYDDQGEQIGELGQSTPSILMALPLPLYACWAHVLLTAARLQQWTTAKRAADVLFPRFIATSASRPVWRAHPMDRHQLQLQQVQAAAAPLLRLFVLAVYVYGSQAAQQHDRSLSEGVSDPGGGAGARTGLASTSASRQLLLQFSDSKVPAQRAVLEWSKKLIAGMQVAAAIEDEMLVEEGALRTYNLLAPLLQQQDISPLLHQALSTIHLTLTAVKETSAHLHGQGQQHIMAARATAAVSYWLMRLTAPAHPALATGAAVGAIGGITGRLPQPAATFAQLDATLLTCLTWQQTCAQGAAHAGDTVAWQGDKGSAAATPSGGKPLKAINKQAKVDADAAAVAATVAEAAAATTARKALSPADAAALAERQLELTAAQDYVMMHPDCALWASRTIIPRMLDSNDLVSQVMGRLSKPDALTTCWPLLSPESARSNPRWVQLCVLVMQAAAKQHGYALLLAMPPAHGLGQGGPSFGLGLGSVTEAVADNKAMHPNIQAVATAAAELVAAVEQQVRLAARMPQFLDWPTDPTWNVDAAAATLQAQGYALGDQGTAAEPPAPQLDPDATADMKASAMGKWEQQRAELLATETRRLAAALLLQQRLPVLLRRRAHLLQTRQHLAAWAPWLAYLHTLLGGLAAEAANSIAASTSSCRALGTAADGAIGVDSMPATMLQQGEGAASSAVVGGASQDGSRPATARSSSEAGGSPGKKTTPRTSRSPTPREKEGKEQVSMFFLTSNEDMIMQLTLQALQQLSQASTLAARAGPAAWQELFNSSKQLWNICRLLINRLPALTTPQPAVAWVQGLLPGPKVPALLAEAADTSRLLVDGREVDGAASGARSKASAADKKKVGEKSGKGTAADKKAAAAAATTGAAGKAGNKHGAPLVPETAIKQLILPARRGPTAASALRAVAEALLATMDRLRAGEAFHSGVVPVQPQLDSNTTSRMSHGQHAAAAAAPATAGDPSAAAPVTARSNISAAASSNFSLGSEAVQDPWHAGGPVAVARLTQLVLLVLKVLHRMQQLQSMISIGLRWLDLCEGSADAELLPLLLLAAPKARASEGVIAALAAAHQACLRDRNSAFDALEKVRALTAERLSGLGLLSRLATTASKPGAKAGAAAACRTGSGTSRGLCTSATLASEKSGMTVATVASSEKGAQSAAVTQCASSADADAVVLPVQYQKVVELLEKRGEKGHMVLAQNELGDVFAHFGMWPQAADAWGSALDTLLGPYQVVANWTHKLELAGGWQQLLARYGTHGLLQAGVLLGKLARYIYYGDLGSRLGCARLAGELLPAVFAASIIHPQRAVDCAVYVPVELWPGVNVFDDPYRCNAADLLSSLETLSSILLDHQLCLPALPLLALWEHVALHITHNSSSLVLARVKRVKALTQLGYLAEAGVVLQGLLQGTNLPGLLLPGPQPILRSGGLGPNQQKSIGSGSKAAVTAKADGGDTSVSTPVYQASKWPGHPSNAAFQAYAADAVLAPHLAAMYGPWLSGHVALARAAWLAAAGGVVNCWSDSSGPTADQLAGAHSTAAAAVHSATLASNSSHSNSKVIGAASAASEAVEGKLLEKAAQTIRATVSASRKALGMPALSGWDQDDAAAAAAISGTAAGGSGSGGNTAAKGSSGRAANTGAAKTVSKAQGGKGGKGADKQCNSAAAVVRTSAAAAGLVCAGGPSIAEQLHQAQHHHLIVAGLQQLAEIELLRWMPNQALQLSLTASAVITARGSSGKTRGGGLQLSSTPAWQAAGCSNDEVERVVLQPSAWLAGRLQVSRALLQLRHYAACISVTSKAVDDATAVGGSLWAVQLLQLQAQACAASGDAAAAMTLMRDAIARMHGMALSGPVLLSVQLDCALLCERLGARGEVDRLVNQALANSSSVVEQQGLQEMLENPEILNIYLPATTTHTAVLLLAATANTRRRQLATAEQQLRQASTLLGCCLCLPSMAAQVALQLAQVLRLQAAIKLPATDLVAAKNLAAAATPPLPAAGQAAAVMPVPALPMRGTELKLKRLQEASSLVVKALQLLIHDAGSPSTQVRTALLELAAGWLYQHQLTSTEAAGAAGGEGTHGAAVDVIVNPCKIASLLQAAHSTAAQLQMLNITSHQLQPVAVSSLPAWLLEQLRAQEQLQLSLQQQSSQAAAAAAAGKASGSHKQRHQQQFSMAVVMPSAAAAVETAIPDSTLGRLALCHYLRLLSSASEGLSGLQQQQLAAAQTIVVQAALKQACPKFAMQCCWPEIPAAILAAESCSIPVGAVNVQWYCQDCCWQEPCSWRSDGILPPCSSSSSSSSKPITREMLHDLPQIPAYASCLYVIHAAGAACAGAAAAGADVAIQQQPKLMCGELVVNVERLKRVKLAVALLRQRLETPARSTDLFALQPPTGRELAVVKHNVEGLLSGIEEEDMGQPPADFPAAATPTSASTELNPAAATAAGTAEKVAAATTAPAATAAVTAAKTGAAAGKGAGVTGVSSGMPAAVGGSGDALVLDWRDVSTWIKIEAMLNVNDGLQGVEGAVAAWLSQLLGRMPASK